MRVHSVLIWARRVPETAFCDVPRESRRPELTILTQYPRLLRHEIRRRTGAEARQSCPRTRAVVLARILPAMSATRTARVFLRVPQDPNQPSLTTPRPNSAPSAVPPPQVSTAPPRPSSVSNSVHLPPELSPPWPWNPTETALIRAGYLPAYKPPTPAASTTTPEASSSSKRSRKRKPVMAEPRARAARHKGQMNFSSERMQISEPFQDPIVKDIQANI